MGQTLDADGLQRLLQPCATPLAQCFVLCGDEILLQVESADTIRARAREQGYVERHRFDMDGRSDWSPVFATTQAVSLFGDKQLIEISIPGGKPGKAGADAIQEICTQLSNQQMPDSLFILQLPRLDRATRNSKWAQSLANQAVWVDVPLVERRALPNWIQQRLKRQQQQAEPEALEWLAEKVEGNLLAAFQEIAKLALLYPEGALSLENVQTAVLNVARYNIFDLRDAMLAGQAQRALTILRGLQGEGEALPLVLWAVGDEVRLLARLALLQANGGDVSGALRQNRVFGPREQLLRQTLQRVPARAWPPALKHAHEIDRLIKGLAPADLLDDAWEEMARLTLRIALAGQRPSRP